MADVKSLEKSIGDIKKNNGKTAALPWNPSSWQQKPIEQQPEYKDQTGLTESLTKISTLPPLVHPEEVDNLKSQLAKAQQGRSFVLQGGDCAERFQDCKADSIEAKLKILLQMSLVLTWGARLPTVRIGRVAGQYGKPRSSSKEKLPTGVEVFSFKGDNVNSYEGSAEAREPDPSRLLDAHFHSACTLNYIRASIKGGIADLHKAKNWDLGGVKDLRNRARYLEVTTRILDALEFMEACGIPSQDRMKDIDFFTSHEALLLNYEEAVTRKVGNQHYNLGAHFLWIGDRTRQLEGAHLEYCRGIANPVGLKIGPKSNPEDIANIVKSLNPTNEPGKVCLITRFGYRDVHRLLPLHIKAIQSHQLKVLWLCDPMHGNTYISASTLKTRSFDHILVELIETFRCHEDHDSHLGGVHFELTGENVTECVGGPQDLSDGDLHEHYTTYCDPRLNYLQSMEISFLLADMLSQEKQRRSYKKPKKKVVSKL